MAVALILVQALLIYLLFRQRADRRQIETALNIVNDRLLLALDSGHIVGWDSDLKTSLNRWFGDLDSVLGVRAQHYITQSGEFLNRVHPDDRDVVMAAVVDSKDQNKPLRIEFRCLHADGSIRWISARGRFWYDPGGSAQRMLGVALDITDRKRAEIALRESEERFRLVANTAPVMIWMSGTDKLCTYFNQPWLDFTGRSIAMELGNGWADSVHPEDFDRCVRTYIEAFDRREPFSMDYRLRRHDGEYRWVLDNGVPRWNPDMSFAGYIGSAIDITEGKQAHEVLRDVSRKLIEVQEEERARIARELHDDINQRVALIAIQADQIAKASADPHVGNTLQDLKEQLIDISSAIQSLSHELHSPHLQYIGIVSAMKAFCSEFALRHKVMIDFDANDVPARLSPEVSLCLFRIFQEALHNAAKYSGVDSFTARLSIANDHADLTVIDKGQGFDAVSAMQSGGLGLVSMRERANLVNGMLEIHSEPLAGTRVRVRIPLVQKRDVSAQAA